MAYVDTNILIAHYFEESKEHQGAEKIVEKLRREGRQAFASSLTVVELASVISRNILKYEAMIPPHIRMYDERRKIRVLVKHMLKSLGSKVADDKPSVERLDEAEAFHIFRRAVDHAPHLKLRALDLLHVAYALQLAEEGLLDVFATLDEGIVGRRDIMEGLGLKVYGPEDA
jgi:predicted nucleic acid-binding protein